METKDPKPRAGAQSRHTAPHFIPIAERRGPTIKDTLRTIIFTLAMAGTTVGVFVIQVCVALPLRFFPLAASHRLSRKTMRFAREAFGLSMAAMSAPKSLGSTSFILTSDESVDLDALVERDQHGDVVGLNLRKNSIYMSNHQSYGDWLYLWIFLVFGNVASGLCIVLAPFLRWGYRLFDFAFVGKGWPIQKSPIGKAVRKAVQDDAPFALLLFPEGTLFASDTQPNSDAFARKAGVPFMRNVLQPRSTGLLFCLRTLISQTPDLSLYDITVGYPGVPAGGYAENYYTLSSTFGRGVPPPAVHLHLRIVDLAAVPSIHPRDAVGKSPKQIDDDLTVEDRAIFQEWTRQRWVEKDELMDHFYEHGKFLEGAKSVQFPVRVRGWGDATRLIALVVAVACVWMTAKTLL